MQTEIKNSEQRPKYKAAAMGNGDGPRIERRKNDLLAQLGHELRSPLGAIRNALQVLKENGEDGSTRAWALGVLDRQTLQMNSLIEHALDFARNSNGKVELIKAPVDLAQVVNLAVETVQPLIEERGHALEFVMQPQPVFLEADATCLEQVLTNLLENAAKYTGPGGRITLTTERAGDDFVLRVRDTGIGIAPTALPHLFDMFWQSSPQAEHSKGGLGVGLALVRQLVEMHGGSVSAYSAGLGLGSEFTVRLPAE